MKKWLGLLLLIAYPVYGQVYASMSPYPARYNDQYLGQNGMPNNGRSTSGDTRYYTQLASGQLITTINDGWGGQGVCSGNSGNNVFVENVSSDLLNETTLNEFMDYGYATCVHNNGSTCGCSNPAGSWTDGAAWKSSTILSDHGNIFFLVRRQQDSPPFQGDYASFVMSQDSGLTWCNYTHVVLQACLGNSSTSGVTADVSSNGQAMWPTLNSVSNVNYCQDNSISCPSTSDSNTTYMYFVGQVASTGANILMRVHETDMASLDVTKYTYWTGSTWSSTLSSAVGVLPYLPESIFYDSTLGYYIGVSFAEMNSGGVSTYSQFVVESATSITGPWTVTTAIPTGDDYNFPQIITSSKVIDGSCTAYTLVAGGSYNYSVPSQPLINNYSSQLFKIKFCANTKILPPTTGQNANDSVVQNGLYQEFNFVPRNDSVVLDSSGQNHNGTAYIDNVSTATPSWGMYTQQGLAGFDQNYNTRDFNVDTGLNYQGTDFTTTLVYNAQGPSNLGTGYMKLLWNGTAFNVQGSFFIQRNNMVLDSFNALVDQDGSSNFNLSDNSWNEVIIVRSGTTTSVYDSNSFNNGVCTPVTTFTAGSHTLTGEIYIGGQIAGGNPFLSGQTAYYNFYSRALPCQDLVRNNSVLIPRFNRKGIALPLPVTGSLLDNQLPYGAWSLRKLVSSYTGNAINITRASDATSTNIGFDGSGNLNNSAVTSFCTGTSCNVNTVYDQSGNHYDWSCGAGQIIYQSGALVTNGSQSRTAILGGSCGISSGFYFFGIAATGEAVMTVVSGSPAYQSWIEWTSVVNNCSNLLNQACAVIRNNTAAQLFFFKNSQNPSPQSITYGTPSVAAGTFGDYYYRFNTDGNASTPLTPNGNTTAAPIRFYANAIGGGPSTSGYFFEAIFLPYSLNGEEYANIRANQKAYYGTP